MTDKTLKGIKACVFDAYGTLFDVHAAAEKCRADLGDKAGPLSQIWRQKQLEYTWLRSLMRDYRDFWGITQDSLDYAMKAVDIDSSDMRKRLLSLYMQLDAFEEVPKMLKTLRKAEIKTAILSNGTMEMLTAAVNSAELGPLINEIHTVAEMGVYKPDPRVYQMTVDKLYIPPEEICFISSNAWDAAGAAHFGFQVVWVNRYQQPIEKLPGQPRFMLKTLTRLPEIVIPTSD